jgi:sulfite reductase beta subunit-like hemoprotein
MITASAAPKVSHNELLKEANPTLGGNIRSTLADSAVDRFAEDDTQFLKFHGIYQQDDRDKRKVAREYIFNTFSWCAAGFLAALSRQIDIWCSTGWLRITETTRYGLHLGKVSNFMG